MTFGIFAAMTGRRSGGPETYETQLIQALSQIPTGHRFRAYAVNAEGAATLRRNSPGIDVHLLRPNVRWISFPISLPLELKRRPVDVVHATYVAPPFLPGKLVFTLHDLSPFSDPDFYPAAIRFRAQRGFASSIRRANAIVCVSEFTRQHLIEWFPEHASKALVIHHGVDSGFRPIMDRDFVRRRLQHYGIRDPYVLCLGKLQARKNTVGAIRAFHKLKKETGAPHKLVMAGRKMWTSSEVGPLIEELGLKDEIVMTGHVPDEDLAILYNGADVLAFPSLFEGFGLPVLEAMACGCPVVTSNVTSLPEIAGKAAAIVDPNNTASIADALARVLFDESYRQELILRGFERVRHFSWAKTAEEVLSVYTAVASGGNIHEHIARTETQRV